jgi:hypothetical protein
MTRRDLAGFMMLCCLAVGASRLWTGCEASRTVDARSDENDSGSGEAGEGGFVLGSVSWIGSNYGDATRDTRAKLHSASVDLGANVVRLSYDPLPGDWPRQVNAPGMLCLFEKLGDGSWRGGKFEWLDPGQTAKTLQNIDNGYNGWQTPARGAQVAIVILSTDGQRSSNPAYTTYD